MIEVKSELISHILEGVQTHKLPTLREHFEKRLPGTLEHEAVMELIEGEMALRRLRGST